MVSDNSADKKRRDISKGDSVCPFFTVQLPASVPRRLRRKGNINGLDIKYPQRVSDIKGLISDTSAREHCAFNNVLLH